MNNLIVLWIDKIQDEALRSAIFRLYNNGIAFIISSVATIGGYASGYFLANGMPTSLKDFTDTALWEYIGIMIISGMLGVASVKKAVRVKIDTDKG